MADTNMYCLLVRVSTPDRAPKRDSGSVLAYISAGIGDLYKFISLMRHVCCLLLISSGVLLSSCNQAPLKLGMEADTTDDVYDSDEESMIHKCKLEDAIEANRQRMQQTEIKIGNLEGAYLSTSYMASYHREKLAELDNAWHAYYRLNNQGTRKYDTRCRHCGETYSMSRDAFQEMLNLAGSHGTTYSMKSYKWFLWAEWDHHTYVTHMEIEKCLRCHQAWSKGYHEDEYRRNNSQLAHLCSQLGGERKKLQNLSKGVEQYQKGAQVLANQSARKLHHKRQKKIEEQRLRIANQALQTVMKEEATLASKSQETAARQHRQKESAALCLLKLGACTGNFPSNRPGRDCRYGLTGQELGTPS